MIEMKFIKHYIQTESEIYKSYPLNIAKDSDFIYFINNDVDIYFERIVVTCEDELLKLTTKLIHRVGEVKRNDKFRRKLEKKVRLAYRNLTGLTYVKEYKRRSSKK